MEKIVIGCDVGLKRIGIAQKIQNIILPLAPIIRKNRNQAARDLSTLLYEKGACVLVVGIPYGLKDMQKRIRHFISLIDFSGQIVYINENLTSLEALDDLRHLRTKSKIKAQKNGIIDSLAACKILERYIESGTK